ncbi:MAG: alkylmercury lyase [Chloroflexi bacterium]|nr:MAG: alkylmercury lyase [Chloroflexota bacterium]MBA4376123.1 hypothetical protein [Anaerolinea sp.]
MEIYLLYFDGCPSWQNAMAKLETASREEKLDISIKLVEVKSDLEATDAKFLGSPSFQINSEDFWPEDRQTYSMNCRVYRTIEGLKGWPSVEMFRQKLIEIRKDKEHKK